jgi:iron complex transport system substrate-binding protein
MMRKSTLIFLNTFLLLALLAGCVPVAAPNTPPTESTSASEAAPEAAVTDECEAGFRIFDHELLVGDPVCIPEAPQRVLPLDMAAMEVVLLTGLTPLGTGSWMLEELPLLLPEYAEALSTVEGLGYPAELEKVAALKPDIILTVEGAIDTTLAREIAPVVVADPEIYNGWEKGMHFWSAVLNVPELADEMEANYAARVEELKAAIGNPEELEISVVSLSTYGIWLWMPDTSPGAILSDVGLSRPQSQSFVGEDAVAEYGDKQYITISEERLDLVDGDAIFYFTYAATDPDVAAQESAFIADLQQKPLWQALDAVKAEKAFFVPGYWWRAQTYLLANKVLDDLFENLTDTTATTPVLGLSGQQ